MKEDYFVYIPENNEQLKKYAEDLVHVYKSEKRKREELEKLNEELIDNRVKLEKEIEERKNAENKLQGFYAELEVMVQKRTAELEAANRNLELFSYSVSHDLRAPLRHIIGFLEMFKEEAGDLPNEKACHYMDVIYKSASRMEQLINDLLAFSRMGNTALSRQNVNLDILLNDVLNEYSRDIQTGKINLHRQSLPVVQGDMAMLRVVFVNLLSNAMKFTAKTENPEIEIGYKIIDNEYIFYIRDNGTGFDMNYTDKLFRVFQRLHNDRDFTGTGIGLAMVKNIIDRHKGRIWAESEQGKGACFYFTLPVERFV